MPNDLQLSDQDEVLLESLVLAASDNVTRAPGADRSQFAPTRRRVFVETDGNENVYLGTGNAWVDVSENTGLLSSLFGGGDGNFDSVNTEDASGINRRVSRFGTEIDSVTQEAQPLNVDIQIPSQYQTGKIYVVVDAESNEASGEPTIGMTVNNETASVYNQYSISGTNTTDDPITDQWDLAVLGGTFEGFWGEFALATPRLRPVITAESVLRESEGNPMLDRGHSEEQGNINSIQITSNNPVTKAEVSVGFDYLIDQSRVRL